MSTISDPSQLTRRQRQVLKMLAEGKDRKEISYELGINLKTVDYHINGHERTLNSSEPAIFQKLGTTNVAILTQWALKHGVAQWVV